MLSARNIPRPVVWTPRNYLHPRFRRDLAFAFCDPWSALSLVRRQHLPPPPSIRKTNKSVQCRHTQLELHQHVPHAPIPHHPDHNHSRSHPQHSRWHKQRLSVRYLHRPDKLQGWRASLRRRMGHLNPENPLHHPPILFPHRRETPRNRRHRRPPFHCSPNQLLPARRLPPQPRLQLH